MQSKAPNKIPLLRSFLIVAIALAIVVWIILRSASPAATIGNQPGNQNGMRHVAIVPPGMTSPFHVSVVDGARAKGIELGWQVEVQATTTESDYEGQVIIVQQLLEMGIDAVSISSLQSGAIVSAVKAANPKQAPVFIHNSLTPFPDRAVTPYIGYNQWPGGAKLCQDNSN